MLGNILPGAKLQAKENSSKNVRTRLVKDASDAAAASETARSHHCLDFFVVVVVLAAAVLEGSQKRAPSASIGSSDDIFLDLPL